jgi:membrane protease YdiL (CAAX protease family)
VLLILYILWIQPDEDLSRFGFRSVDVPDVLAGVVTTVVMFAVLAAAGALLLLLPDVAEDAIRSGFRFRINNPALLPLAFLSSLAIAYREEAFFRAYLLTRLEQLSVNPAVAVVVASAAFSLGHMYQGVGGALVAFVLGLFLGWVFLRRRTVHVVAIAHGLYNFTVLALTAVGVEFG